jgi:hypothetical protein
VLGVTVLLELQQLAVTVEMVVLVVEAVEELPQVALVELAV